MEEKREGYIFGGWYVDKELTRRLNPGGVLPGSIKLYPKWIPQKFPVYYELDEGVNSEYNPHEVDVESEILKLFPARSTGRQFVGWFWNGKKVEYLEQGIHEPVNLKGVFQDPVQISFETGHGADLRPVQAGTDGLLKKAPRPFRMGFEFTRWYLDAARRRPWNENHVFLDDATLYAGWKLKEYEIRYDPDGGFFEEDPVERFTFESATFLLPAVYRPGYDFAGWFDERGNQQLMVRHGSINNRNLQARWIKKNKTRLRIKAPGTSEE